jgi:hypothetical protein
MKGIGETTTEVSPYARLYHTVQIVCLMSFCSLSQHGRANRSVQDVPQVGAADDLGPHFYYSCSFWYH